MQDTAAIGPGSAPACKASLEQLPPIVDLLASWAEQEAVRADGAADWLPAELALEADDRCSPSVRDDSPGAATAPALVSRREDKSALPPYGTLTPLESTGGPAAPLLRYGAAVARVDAAYDLLEQELVERLEELGGHWSARAQLAADGVRRKLAATRSRRLALRECTLGKARVIRFRCQHCGGLQYGPPAGCNSRVCPRCIKKRRREGMARVGQVLDELDRARRAAGRPLPRWRFVTLTAPSWSSFAPMRRCLAAAVTRLQHRELWADRVRAAVVTWETTHTRAGWHVHAHALVDAFIPRDALARAWQQVVVLELAGMIGRGVLPAGAPAPVLELADTIRADELARVELRRAALRLCRFADARGLELAAALEAAPSTVTAWHTWRTDGRRRRRRELVRDFRAELEQLLAGAPLAVGVNCKELGGSRSRVLSELAKYAGKDLGGAQVDDAGEFGVAGTTARLAEFIAGAWRWRTLRTYGEAYRRDDVHAGLECDGCGRDGLAFEGTEWLDRDDARRLEADRAARSRERRELRGTLTAPPAGGKP